MNLFELLLGSILVGAVIGCQADKANPDAVSPVNEPQIEIVAGSSTGAGYGYRDGVADSAKFRLITSITFGESGDLYVTDNLNEVVRVVSLQQKRVATLAGRVPGREDYTFQGDKDGPLGVAELLRTRGITPDGTGGFYIMDSYRGRVRQVASNGRVVTLGGVQAGNDVQFRNGPLNEAVFFNPWDMAIDKAGNLYVAELTNSCIRKISPDRIVSTFAGVPRVFGYKNGRSDSAIFNAPGVLALDTEGNLFVAERDQPRIRKITPMGEVSTFAGGGNDGVTRGDLDGPGKTALFGFDIKDMAFDPAGNLYVSDAYNGTIRKITPAGVVSTVVRTKQGIPYGNVDPRISGVINTLAVDKMGNLYAATEQTIYRIRLN